MLGANAFSFLWMKKKLVDASSVDYWEYLLCQAYEFWIYEVIICLEFLTKETVFLSRFGVVCVFSLHHLPMLKRTDQVY